MLGATEDPEKTSTRIAFLTTFVGGLLLYSSYSASLTSFLAIVQVAYPFVDLHSLYFQSDFKIGSVGGTVMDNYFAVSSELLNSMYQPKLSVKKYVVKNKVPHLYRNFLGI